MGALCILASLAFLLYADRLVTRAASGLTFSSPDAVPANRVGLVLGCSASLADGRSNLYFSLRLRAAADLYAKGRIQYVLVSGDNHRRGYDEPSDMKAELVRLGVPEDRITCDYAGFSTLDSIVRAKEVFGLSRLTVISQRFHNQRAVYIAGRRGMDVVGYDAPDVGSWGGFRTRAREVLARARAVLDVSFLRREPRFLGKPVRIG